MTGHELLAQVLDSETAAEATLDDCIVLLNGALRLKADMDPELLSEVEHWLFSQWEALEPIAAPWPTAPQLAQLTNGYDGWYSVALYPDNSNLRQDAHVIELPIHKEVAMSEFVGDKEFIEVEKHPSPAGVEVPGAPLEMPESVREEVAGMVEAAVIDNIAGLGIAGLAAKTVRQLKAMCRLLSCRIGGRKAEIVARLAGLAELTEMVPEPKAPVGDPQRYAVSMAELLPSLVHRTSDGRWYLKEHKVVFLATSTTEAWACKGINAKVWAKYEGLVMLVPAVTIVD